MGFFLYGCALTTAIIALIQTTYWWLEAYCDTERTVARASGRRDGYDCGGDEVGKQWEHDAIELGFARYNPKDGDFEWLSSPASPLPPVGEPPAPQ